VGCIVSVVPLRADIHALQGRIETRVDRIEKQLEALPDMRGRLARIETLLLEQRQPE
jgi:hypothetical protein